VWGKYSCYQCGCIWGGRFFEAFLYLLVFFPLNNADCGENYYKVILKISSSSLFKNKHFLCLAAQKNNHHFESEQEEKKSLIYQFSPFYTGNISVFQQCYMFD
jgi:hypothetical protein